MRTDDELKECMGKCLKSKMPCFPKTSCFPKKHRVFCRYDIFIGFEAPGIGIFRINSRIPRIPNIPETELPGNAGQARIFQ